MKPLLLFRNIRFYILLFSTLLSFFTYVFFLNKPDPSYYLEHNLTHTYALTAAFFLYLALLAGPFCYNFKTPINSYYLKARRAIGVSAWYFASLHLFFAFFFVLGGFQGIFASEAKYILAIFLGETTYIIITFMAATSFDFVIKKMTFKKWKMLHRLVYVGSILILIHILIIGEHFQDINTISATAVILLSFLAFLEGKRLIANVKTKFSKKSE